MNFFKKFWRVPALALVVALPLFAACADDEGAGIGQVGDGIGTISGKVTSSEPGNPPIAGALVGTNPATTTALTPTSEYPDGGCWS